MPALNRVQLIGRLGKEPESRFTPNGKKVAHFSLGDYATPEERKRDQRIYRMGERGSLGTAG